MFLYLKNSADEMPHTVQPSIENRPLEAAMTSKIENSLEGDTLEIEPLSQGIVTAHPTLLSQSSFVCWLCAETIPSLSVVSSVSRRA